MIDPPHTSKLIAAQLDAYGFGVLVPPGMLKWISRVAPMVIPPSFFVRDPQNVEASEIYMKAGCDALDAY